jgi:hypothetical protein
MPTCAAWTRARCLSRPNHSGEFIVAGAARNSQIVEVLSGLARFSMRSFLRIEQFGALLGQAQILFLSQLGSYQLINEE